MSHGRHKKRHRINPVRSAEHSGTMDASSAAEAASAPSAASSAASVSNASDAKDD
jgi:hypothetical protein